MLENGGICIGLEEGRTEGVENNVFESLSVAFWLLEAYKFALIYSARKRCSK
jgi:hypothetical protein